MGACTATHPEYPDTRCAAPGANHPQHYGYSRAIDDYPAWANDDYVEPPKKEPSRRGEAEAHLAGIAAGVPPRRSVGETIPSRNVDPETSHRATETITIRANTQRHLLLAAFGRHGGGLTDEQAMGMADEVSPTSEYAKRCSELRDAGLILPTGEVRLGGRGVERMVSQITEAGFRLLRELGSPEEI